MYDLLSTIPAGTEGIIERIDDIGTIHVNWENGSTLGLVVGVDEFEIDKNVYLIYSKEAKSLDFPMCREFNELKTYSNFVVIKKENNKFASLNDIELKKYIKMFSIKD